MQHINLITTLFTAVLAAIIGSFLNMLIYRLPIMMEREWQRECEILLNTTTGLTKKERPKLNLAFPASHCPQCKTPLKFWHNIPLISFLFLKGKCASCKKAIPRRYFLVELLSVILAIVLALKFGFSWQLAGSLIFTWLLIAISFIDIDKMLIPDTLNYLLLWTGLFCSSIHLYPAINAGEAIIGAISAYLALSIVANGFRLATKKEGMGHGDFKLFAALAAWTGWQMLVFIILIASIIALIYGGIALLGKKQTKNTPIPFGPFLATGGWLVFFFHITLLGWYY